MDGIWNGKDVEGESLKDNMRWKEQQRFEVVGKHGENGTVDLVELFKNEMSCMCFMRLSDFSLGEEARR